MSTERPPGADRAGVRTSRRVVIVVAALVALGLVAALVAVNPFSSGRSSADDAGTLSWKDCGTSKTARAADVQCSSATLPMDYGQPKGAKVHIAVGRVPATDAAHRIGSLFFNFGGPGASAVDYVQGSGAGDLFATLNKRFDIVAFDPRGVGQSTPSIDCHVDQETQGIYSMPVPTPQDLDTAAYTAKAQAYVDACVKAGGPILQHASTANVARDLDALRADVGDAKLSYLGFSYGTFLGATYASLFPRRYRAMVLDGPVDATQYVNDPMEDIAEQTAGFEDALTRFEAACATDQRACSGFGGATPGVALDDLIAAAGRTPIPAPRYTDDPRAVTADDVRQAVTFLLYRKSQWGAMGVALEQARQGDATILRAVVDEQVYQRRTDGTFAPDGDRYFTIGATEQHYPTDLATYWARGAKSWADYPHFWANSGYAEVSYALWPKHDADAFAGPFRVPASSPTPLVVATTHDPATPYPGAQALVADLGNARLLTMDGDGHTAYGGDSACIDAAVDAYLTKLTLPAEGTRCAQQVPFEAPQQQSAGAAAGGT